MRREMEEKKEPNIIFRDEIYNNLGNNNKKNTQKIHVV